MADEDTNETEMGLTKAAQDRVAQQKKADNVNQYAVKHKLGQRKVERSQINQKQVNAYAVLQDYLQRRRALPVGVKEESVRSISSLRR